MTARSKAITAGIIAVVVFLGWYIWRSRKTTTGLPPTVAADSLPTVSGGVSSDSPAPNTVLFTLDGFVPNVIKIKAGETLRLINTSSQDCWPTGTFGGSDKALSTNQSYETAYKTAGTYRLTDKLRPAATITITVE